ARALDDPAEALSALEAQRFALEARLSRPGPIAPDVAAAARAAELPLEPPDGLAFLALGPIAPEHPLPPGATAQAAALLGALPGRRVLLCVEGASAAAALEAAEALRARLVELGVAAERLHPLGFEALPGRRPSVALGFRAW